MNYDDIKQWTSVNIQHQMPNKLYDIRCIEFHSHSHSRNSLSLYFFPLFSSRYVRISHQILQWRNKFIVGVGW